MFVSKLTVNGYRASAEQRMECTFPGRFSVLVGPNNGGKTTIADALYLAHAKRFPQLQRPSSGALGANPRLLEVEFSFEGSGGTESQLGDRLIAEARDAPRWERTLERNLGSVRSSYVERPELADNLLLLCLPAHRNPLDELARREAQSLIELLRAEQERRMGHRNLVSLRTAAEHALDHLVGHPLLRAVEERIGTHLDYLSSGVQHQHVFVGRQRVDDAFIARVLELLLATVDQRALAQRLELSGLGYVNLLHIAVTLAAIPGSDPLGSPANDESDTPEGSNSMGPDDSPSPANDEGPLEDNGLPKDDEEAFDSDEEATTMEDTFFPKDLLHATVVIEEPEAHLHPQLHRGLVAYLRRTVATRPEVQIVLTSHSSDVVTGCDPAELVVMRREEDGTRVSRPVAHLPLTPARKKRVLRMTALHLDASRSASLFAERVLLVEGITEAAVVRQLGRAWAGNDAHRLERIEALTIVPMGTKVGEWPVQLLATPDFELSQRVAILSDTDHRDDSTPPPGDPTWLASYPATRVKRFTSHPTLEPTLVASNHDLIRDALDACSIAAPGTIEAESVDELFRSKKSKKAEFAFELAGQIHERLSNGLPVSVPEELQQLFGFITAAPSGPATPDNADSASDE